MSYIYETFPFSNKFYIHYISYMNVQVGFYLICLELQGKFKRPNDKHLIMY